MSLPHYSAGIGVLNAARKTMARMLGNNKSAFESARSQFWVVDAMVSLCKESSFESAWSWFWAVDGVVIVHMYIYVQW